MTALPVTQRLQKQLPSPGLIKLEPSGSYPADNTAWHADVRGYDGPRWELMKHEKHHAALAKKVVISFQMQNNPDVPVLVCGTFVDGVKDGPILRWLEVQWLSHSQVPCLRLKVIRGSGKAPASVWIFGRDIQSVVTAGDGCKVSCVHAIANKYEDDPHPDTGIALDRSHHCTVWETKVSTGPVEQPISHDASQILPYSNGLRATGIDPDDLRQLLELGNLASEKGDLTVLSSGDWAIWGLLSTNLFHIYRMWPKGKTARKVYNYFTAYMTARLNEVAEHGYWPHYRRQAADLGIPFDEFTADLSAMEHPRQMIREWRVTYVNDVPVQALPDKWAGFLRLNAYPDMRTKAFALRVEAERQTGLERALFPLARITSDGRLIRASDKAVAPTSTVSDYFPNDPGSVDWSANPLNPESSEMQNVYRKKGRLWRDRKGRDTQGGKQAALGRRRAGAGEEAAP